VKIIKQSRLASTHTRAGPQLRSRRDAPTRNAKELQGPAASSLEQLIWGASPRTTPESCHRGATTSRDALERHTIGAASPQGSSPQATHLGSASADNPRTALWKRPRRTPLHAFPLLSNRAAASLRWCRQGVPLAGGAHTRGRVPSCVSNSCHLFDVISSRLKRKFTIAVY